MTFCGLITTNPSIFKDNCGQSWILVGDINIIKGSVTTRRVFALPFNYKIFVAWEVVSYMKSFQDSYFESILSTSGS